MAHDSTPAGFKPYIPAEAQLPEMTFRALLMGVVLGMVFGASSLYLVLKVGLTVSASIPVAVIAITLFGLARKAGSRDSTILENSITQTAGSAGESIAFGLGVTMPAIMVLGFDLEISCDPGRRARRTARRTARHPDAPGTMLIRDMGPDDIRSAYVLYIGAGAVATGGLISLARSLPTIWKGMKGGLAAVGKGSSADATLRTDRDIPLKWVLIGCLAIIVAITLATPLHMNVLGALLILVFGFLFSTVSSHLTGEVGSSSCPTSGMAVATLLFTCLIFLLMGWTGGQYYVTALSVGAIVCIASSNAGTTSQDLKTGFLVGSTPRLQQYAILCGALARFRLAFTCRWCRRYRSRSVASSAGWSIEAITSWHIMPA
jgi:uncharacterized oligopeptide transporter (OPT) family protein